MRSRLKPVLTEKSIAEAKEGRYTFEVSGQLRKPAIGRLVSKAFGVKVVKVRTINYRSITKTNLMRRKKMSITGKKKAIVTLAGKDKIDVFGERDSKKK